MKSTALTMKEKLAIFSDKERKLSTAKIKLLLNCIAQTKRQWKINDLRLMPGYC